ncbi:hypothetical protein Hanom_Chr15g01346491 [Helianthus anomalus]
MRWKPGSKHKSVCRENNKGKFIQLRLFKLCLYPCYKLCCLRFVVAPLWCLFAEDNKGKIVIEDCDDDGEGWYDTIYGNFCVPDA